MFTGKHLCWGLFLIKLNAFKPATFLKRDFHTGVFCGDCEIFESSFFYSTHPVAASNSPTTVQ